MATEEGAAEHLLRRGLAVLDPELALTALHRALDHDDALVTVADVRWEQFAPAFASSRPSPLLGDLPRFRQAVQGEQAAAEPSAEVSAALKEKLADLEDSERDAALLGLVRSATATVLGYSSAEYVEPERAFQDVGIDSLTAVELRNSVSAATGLRLPATAVFDYPTPLVLAEQVRAGLWPEGVAEAGLDEDEAKVQRFLSTVSMSDLRAAGVIDILLRAADSFEEKPAAEGHVEEAEIGAMDADDLVRFVLGSNDS
jgi:acyl carrier protein